MTNSDDELEKQAQKVRAAIRVSVRLLRWLARARGKVALRRIAANKSGSLVPCSMATDLPTLTDTEFETGLAVEVDSVAQDLGIRANSHPIGIPRTL